MPHSCYKPNVNRLVKMARCPGLEVDNDKVVGKDCTRKYFLWS